MNSFRFRARNGLRPFNTYTLNPSSILSRGLVRVYPHQGELVKLGFVPTPGTMVWRVSGLPPVFPCPDLGGTAIGSPASLGYNVDTVDDIVGITGSNGTFSTWMYPFLDFSNNGFDQYFAGQNGGTTNGFEIRRYVDGNYYCGFFNSSPYRVVVTVTASNWRQYEWQLLTITWVDGVGSILYHNGVQIGSQAGLVLGTPPSTLGIGANDGGATAPSFQGSQTNICIWNRALSPQEVYALYAMPTRFSMYNYPQSPLNWAVGSAPVTSRRILPIQVTKIPNHQDRNLFE